jgi:hypothetical protein
MRYSNTVLADISSILLILLAGYLLWIQIEYLNLIDWKWNDKNKH